MRTEKSIKNVTVALIGQLLSYVLNFVLRMIFVRTLTSEYLGINGLFTNILSIISIVELGFGAAITVFLYKPVANNNVEQISKLIRFYSNIYKKIGIIIFIIAISVIPFLNFLIPDASEEIKSQIVYLYLIFIVNSVIPYFFIHYKCIIEVHQEKYIVVLVHYLLNIALLILQAIILIFFKNFILYMLMQVNITIIENFLICKISKKKYKDVFLKQSDNIEKYTKIKIFQKTKSMSLQLIGNVALNGTDNILMSIFSGINYVGIYSNYYLIISVIENITLQIFSAIQASIGNLSVEANKEKKYYIYKVLDFINFWIAAFFSISYGIIIQDFIAIWIGDAYILPEIVVLVITINLFMQLSNKVNTIYKYSIGIIEKDKYASLIGAFINLISSIILTKLFGIIGIFIGTTISLLCTQIFVEPYILYKYIFKCKFIEKVKKYSFRFFLTILIGVSIYFISKYIYIANNILKIIVLIIICTIFINGCIYMIYRKTDEMKYIIDIVKRIKEKKQNHIINNKKGE